MPFSIVAFQESEDEAGAYANKAAVPDDIVSVNGDIIYVPAELAKLLGAYAACGGTVEGAAYLKSPSLRAMAYYDIYPCQEGIGPSGGESVLIHPDLPIDLVANEGLEALVKSNPGSTEVHSVVCFLGDNPTQAVQGPIRPVKFTTAITETVGAWKNGALTLSQTLPVGRYQIVGAAMWGTSGVAFRFNLKGSTQRPGFICHSSEGNAGNLFQRHGRMGVWGEFDSLTPPTIEWLANATSGSAQTGVMDLIKVA